jgi:hypothetical protein
MFEVIGAGRPCRSSTCGRTVLIASRLRFKVVDAVATFAADMIVGNPLDPSTTCGPMASKAHLDRVLGYIDIARARPPDWSPAAAGHGATTGAGSSNPPSSFSPDRCTTAQSPPHMIGYGLTELAIGRRLIEKGRVRRLHEREGDTKALLETAVITGATSGLGVATAGDGLSTVSVGPSRQGEGAGDQRGDHVLQGGCER